MLGVPGVDGEVQKLTNRSGLPLLGNRQFHAHVPGFIRTIIHAQGHFEFTGVGVGFGHAALDVLGRLDVGQPHRVGSHRALLSRLVLYGASACRIQRRSAEFEGCPLASALQDASAINKGAAAE